MYFLPSKEKVVSTVKPSRYFLESGDFTADMYCTSGHGRLGLDKVLDSPLFSFVLTSVPAL